jgi:hypothetical protein
METEVAIVVSAESRPASAIEAARWASGDVLRIRSRHRCAEQASVPAPAVEMANLGSHSGGRRFDSRLLSADSSRTLFSVTYITSEHLRPENTEWN